MKTSIIVFSALFALMSFASVSAEGETQPSTEIPAQRVHVLNPGEREYLSPNLIGVQNIAITNIPVTLDFVNIIDAFREVVDGVKYEILLNALNTTDNNTEIVCRIVVLEKPWLTTLWGDKVRLLKESNCTSEELLDNVRDRKSIEEKYETNAIFTGNRNELTADDMSKLESQILGTSKNPQLRRQQTLTTTTTTTTESVPSEDNTEPINSQIYGDENVDNTGATTQEIPLSTEASTTTTTTTTEKLPELSADEKKWLDDFLSIGAYNFEITHQAQSESQNNEEQLSDQEPGKRVTRQIVGGVRKLNDEELKDEEKNLADGLVKLASGEGPYYTISKVHSGTIQVVSGSLVKLDVELSDSKTNEVNRCTVSIWSQPWLKENGYEYTFECKDKAKVVQRHSRSAEEASSRLRRSLVGAAKELNEEELAIEEEKIKDSFTKIAAGEDGPFYTISKIYSATKRVVAGTLVEFKAELIDDISGEKTNCTVSSWVRLWLPVDGHEVSIQCQDKPKTIHRHSRSVEYAQKKTHKKSHRNLNKAEYLFQKFQLKYNKTYQSSMEHQMRMRIFKHNLRLIMDLNKYEMGSAKYGITEFADMTTTEYRERTGLLPREETNAVRSQATIPDIELPKEFDWREKGVVSPVKNQGNCGSCWAFSVTGNIEGIHAVKTGKLEEYSEQELLDCDTIDSACGGGLPDNAYQAIEKIGGLELESEYPYEARKGKCHFNKTLAHVKVSGAVDLPKNETAMAQWLIANGPISIGINANAMQFYRGGVSHPWKVLCSKSNLDHGVLIVGYGVSDYPMFKKTLPYWIIKNSWGPKWGEQGYYRVYRGDNTCGVSEMATSAQLA